MAAEIIKELTVTKHIITKTSRHILLWAKQIEDQDLNQQCLKV